MSKAKENPNHHMGKQTGYELKSGVYHIAPKYQEQFERMAIKREGIEQMVAIVTSHAAQELAEIAKINNSIWDELRDDIGMDKNKKWRYFSATGTVTEIPEVGGKQ